MTKHADGWPGKPGFPMNPGKSGWHWLSWQGGEPRAWEYDAELNPYGKWRTDEGHLGAWLYHEPLRYGATGMQTPDYMVSNGWRYLGPCLSPGALANDAPAMLAALEIAFNALRSSAGPEERMNAMDILRALLAKHMEPNQ